MTTSEPGRGGDVGQEARGLADDMKREAAGVADSAKQAGGEQLDAVAQAATKAADALSDEAPRLSELMKSAADGVQNLSRTIESRSAGELVDEALAFARREPATFLAASAAAGFALARLVKLGAGSTAPRPAQAAAIPARPATAAPLAPPTVGGTTPAIPIPPSGR